MNIIIIYEYKIIFIYIYKFKKEKKILWLKCRDLGSNSGLDKKFNVGEKTSLTHIIQGKKTSLVKDYRYLREIFVHKVFLLSRFLHH